LVCQAPGFSLLSPWEIYTLGADIDRRREEMDKKREGGMAIEGEFPLLEMFRLLMYSLESSDSWCVFLLCFLLFL